MTRDEPTPATVSRRDPGAERPPRILTVAEAARFLKIRRAKVREAILSGELRAARIGRLFRIHEDDLLRYFDAHIVVGAGSSSGREGGEPRR